ncbi:hypothetical protein Acsp05_69860 [Actinokineospora sp. NBRC 105648]|nr:hypothetical protein Acsp05_69860 [Actinokineospora sp. NBRC 105648]
MVSPFWQLCAADSSSAALIPQAQPYLVARKGDDNAELDRQTYWCERLLSGYRKEKADRVRDASGNEIDSPDNGRLVVAS